ncbi:M16 family metallopeptidase [Tenacibaculum haliotis]|uniref:M16 family metallopeptidase n=1 Tax=Tenacibaculum haliotis TaxID=1888914 RepID=UPI0021AF44A2|nr:pitrilysin family protein [Tenacibaculum haliotis]MCT4698387.1 insulinase family protein [Tenacibaculum haliotis]
MKTKILSIIAVITMSFAVNAQIDRSKMPTPGPDPVVKLGSAEKFSLDNGMTVIMVENHKLPRVAATLRIDNKPYSEGNIAGVSSIMGSLLGRGTANITKDEFNEKVDFLGANVGFFSTGASARSLKKYFPEVLGLMADGVKNSQFSQEEFDTEKKVTLENLKSAEKNIPAIANRVESVLLYGKNHPNGEFTSKKTVNNITLDAVKNNFNTYYKPNNAYLIIVGDINPSEIKKLVKSLFSDWKKGTIPAANFPKPENVATTEINFVNMPNANQSEVAVVNTIDLTLGDKDYYAALLANKILGGGGSARLFQNLREDKAYTYGSYSRVSQSRTTGVFRAYAGVRNVVTDSAVVEIQKEINKIRYQKVSEKELQDAKEEYIGGFVMDVQKPATAANYALNIALYNLPQDFYANYIKNINSVTINDVQNAAIKYFRGDRARIMVTGKGIDVLKNLEKNSDYKINYFDTEGNPTTKPAMTLPIPAGITTSSVVDKYFTAIGGKEKVAAVKSVMIVSTGKVQAIDLTMTQKHAAPNKTAVVVTGMGQTLSKQIFDGTSGYAEQQGQRRDLDGDDLAAAKSANAPFADAAYKAGKLDRIEPIDGENFYVIKHNKMEIFYNVKTGLKAKEVRTVKGPQGEMKLPTTFSDYKEVNGIKFPHKMGQKMGPMNLSFETKEVKINEGVSDADFQ